MESQTLPSFFASCCRRFADREMLAFAPEREVTLRWSGTDLRAQVHAAEGELLALGVTKGTHVALLCTNRPEWVVWAFAAWKLGAVVVPLSTLWKVAELRFALQHADVEVLVAMQAFRDRNYAAEFTSLLAGSRTEEERVFSPAFPTLRRVRFFATGSQPDIRERSATRSSEPQSGYSAALEARVGPADRAAIFFTSGTTAQPKAIVHCHQALLVSAERIAAAVGIDAADVWWGHLPLFWTGGFVLGLLATWCGGGRIVLQERVEAGAALELLEREQCTIMTGWHQAGPLLEHPDFPRRRVALRKGSAHALAGRLLAQPHFAVGMYGLSETATCVASARWDEPEPSRLHSCGRPLPGTDVRIVDPDSGRLQPPGATGEICVRGVTLMEGYYKIPPQECFDAEGFFHTGDLGFMDEEGRLHFTGRVKDVIKTAGVNVSVREVEDTLVSHPAVQAAYVVGVAHPTRGENVAAFVVRQPEARVSEAELVQFCRERLASYKVPRHLFFLAPDAVPRTATGKVEKAALRREAERRIEPPVARI